MKTKNKPVFISGGRRVAENCPTQRDSGISSLAGGTMGVMGVMGIMGSMWKKHKSKSSPAQLDSEISNLVLSLYPLRPLRLNLLSAQRDSKMSNGRLSGLSCWPHGGRLPENSPAQRNSEMSKLGIGLIGPMGHIGLMSQKPVMKNAPAQRNSKMSSLAEPVKTASAQRDSKMSNLVSVDIVTQKSGTEGIFTMQIKNIGGCFRDKHGNGAMSKMQNSLPQRHSKDNMRGDLPPVVYNIWSAQSTKY